MTSPNSTGMQQTEEQDGRDDAAKLEPQGCHCRMTVFSVSSNAGEQFLITIG